MKIVAYTDQEFGPFIPVALQEDTLEVHGPLEPSHSWYEVSNPFELSEDQWIGVMPDRTIVRIPKSRIQEWKVRTAQEIIRNIGDYPIPQKMGILRACAALCGSELGKVLGKMDSERREGETYAQAFERLRSKNSSNT